MPIAGAASGVARQSVATLNWCRTSAPRIQKMTSSAQVGLQGDLTLAELQRLLLVQLQVKVSIGRLWALLRSLDLRLKKSRSTPPSGTRKPTGNSVPRISNGSAR